MTLGNMRALGVQAVTPTFERGRESTLVVGQTPSKFPRFAGISSARVDNYHKRRWKQCKS
jgi:hypothetical protein